MSTVQTKQTNLREKLAELLDFRKMRDRLSGLGLYIGKDRTGTDENLLVRGGANVDDLQIGEIAALVGGTAVDVFVYDTSRDSDGGKWRERTQHTSWYNETLNTATRGGRREFPAVAVIVAETDKVTIYDGDDPDLSMWMVFTSRSFGIFNNNNTGHSMLSVTALNGIVCGGANMYTCVSIVNFIADTVFKQSVSTEVYAGSYFRGLYKGDISQRESGIGFDGSLHGYSEWVVANTGNDVAMTVLLNAPIDQNTGLPVPTIAVATDGGVSVIKDDGTVVDIVSSQGPTYNYSRFVSFDNNNKLLFGMDQSTINTSRRVHWHDIPSSDKTIDINGVTSELYTTDATNSDVPDAIGGSAGSNDQSFALDGAVAGSRGLTKVERSDNRFAFITSKYNTGWMPGDIKLATLSDTTVETIGQSVVDVMPNGTFESNIDGWTPDPSSSLVTLSQVTVLTTSTGSKAMLVQKIGDNYTYAARYSNLLTPGKRYRITGRVNAGWTTAYKFRIRAGGSLVTWSTTDDLVQDDWVNFDTGWIVADGSHLEIGSASYGGGGIDNFFIDDVVVLHDSTELITNGDFSTDSGWEKGTGWSIVGGVASKASSIDSSNLTQEIDCVIGQTYVISWDITSRDSSAVGFYTPSGGSITAVNNYYESVGSYSETFTATSESVTIALRAGSTAVLSIDNISVRPAVDDRSVNNNGLQIVGEINKTPVASGADLVAYSGFSANNYLVQPYNEDLDFGTGDFCVMGWVNQPEGQTSYLFDRRSGANDGISMSINSNNLLYVSIRNGTSDSLGGVNFPTDSWAFMSFVRRDGIGYIYVNGILLSQGNLDDDVSENTPLVLGGISYTNIGYCAASLALFRISATAPTPEQIAKIYRDEKVLFTDGAQATLYGTSDAVTALAYDEKMQLLHVGTSSGRSDFSGLRRINNTTTAITTSISAHNNLIAEQ